MTTLGKENRVS